MDCGDKKIAVYCASSTQIDECYFKDARRLGNLMADSGVTLVNGAGCSGLMAASADGCLELWSAHRHACRATWPEGLGHQRLA